MNLKVVAVMLVAITCLNCFQRLAEDPSIQEVPVPALCNGVFSGSAFPMNLAPKEDVVCVAGLGQSLSVLLMSRDGLETAFCAGNYQRSESTAFGVAVRAEEILTCDETWKTLTGPRAGVGGRTWQNAVSLSVECSRRGDTILLVGTSTVTVFFASVRGAYMKSDARGCPPLHLRRKLTIPQAFDALSEERQPQ